jgi:hypothetical protein
MEAPLALSMNLSSGAEMAIGLVTGIGFGFALERGGFGRADNLAAIFYGRDFRVMRVMFTAILTAMLGLYLLDLIGVMPLGNIGLLPTFVLPQLVGGLLLGAGFVIGGYCPGTSFVGMASGKLDAVFFLGGLFGGTMFFTVAYDLFAALRSSTEMGRVLLHEYFGIPSGPMVVVVVLFALGAFAAVGKIEALVNRTGGQQT